MSRKGCHHVDTRRGAPGRSVGGRSSVTAGERGSFFLSRGIESACTTS